MSRTEGSVVRRFAYCAGIAFLLALVVAWGPQTLRADEQTRFFPETGMSVSWAFKSYFEERGGVEIFGYPITPEIQEDGRTVQYFQRARFEYHPEHAGTRYEVELGLLGDILTAGREFLKASPEPETPTQRYFPETQHIVRGEFLRFFDSKGGLDIFGYPISEVILEDGRGVQYFQRARFEYYPQMPEDSRIVLGNLGEELAERVGPRGSFWVSGMPDTILPNQTLRLQVRVQNVGIMLWPAQGPSAVAVGFHLIDARGATAQVDSRVALPAAVRAGSEALVWVSIQIPPRGGDYTLQWDLWQGGRGWVAARDPTAATRQVLVVQRPTPTPAPAPAPYFSVPALMA